MLVKGARVTTLLGKIESIGEAKELNKKARAALLPKRWVLLLGHLDGLDAGDTDFHECGAREFYHLASV